MQLKHLLVHFVFLFAGQTYALEVGEIAPAFTLPNLANTNEQMTLQNHLGRVLYVDFWASWCAPCRVSFPEISNLHQSMDNRLFEIVSINVDENPKDALRFLSRFPVDYAVLSDSTGKVASQYELPGMPTSFVVNQAGEVTLIHVGFKPGDMTAIAQHIEGLLAAPSPSLHQPGQPL